MINSLFMLRFFVFLYFQCISKFRKKNLRTSPDFGQLNLTVSDFNVDLCSNVYLHRSKDEPVQCKQSQSYLIFQVYHQIDLMSLLLVFVGLLCIQIFQKAHFIRKQQWIYPGYQTLPKKKFRKKRNKKSQFLFWESLAPRVQWIERSFQIAKSRLQGKVSDG